MDRRTLLQLRDPEAMPHLPTNLVGISNRDMTPRERRTMSREVAFRVLAALKQAGGSMNTADLIAPSGPIGLGRAAHEIAEGIDYGEELCMFTRNIMTETVTATI